MANAQEKLKAAREANKEALVAAERKDLAKATRELLKHLDGATGSVEKMKAISRRILWLNTGRAKVPAGFLVPAMHGEGGEETISVERLIEALKAFACDPSPRDRPNLSGSLTSPAVPWS